MLSKISLQFLSLVSVCLAQTITSCPGGDTVYTAPDGSKWNTCINSDYQGGSDQVFGAVPTLSQCAQICQQYRHLGCVKAVYDKQNKYCHIKANSGLNWVANNGQYDSVRILSEAPSGNKGKWAAKVNLPLVPAGAFIVPEQPVSYRILGYSAWATNAFGGGQSGKTQFTDYNWRTGAVSQREVSNTQHDMFCPGQSYLADGTMVITGGENAEAVSRYDYRTNSWTRLPNMKVARGYQSSTILSNGNIFTIGGSFTGGIGDQDVPFKNGEIYNPSSNTWTALPGTDVRPMLTQYDREGKWRTDNHAWLFGWKSGSVFQAGPSRTMNWYTTSGTGGVKSAGIRDTQNDAMCGVNVMYDAVAGKIFSAGGSQSYKDDPALTRAHIITIGEVNATASVEQLSDLKYARGVGNAVVLPNGQVIITGGQLETVLFTDVKSVFNAELWDPSTKQFTALAPGTVGRNYHAVSLLLADGRVWVGGGGLCYQGGNCPAAAQHFDGEIFTPPYLLKSDGSAATRPSISSLTSNIDSQGYKVRVGGTLRVTMNDSTGATFSLVRIGSATHSVNSDQRRVPLTNVVKSSATYTLTVPSDSGIVNPGYYYLFAMNTNGVPCVARTVQITL